MMHTVMNMKKRKTRLFGILMLAILLFSSVISAPSHAENEHLPAGEMPVKPQYEETAENLKIGRGSEDSVPGETRNPDEAEPDTTPEMTPTPSDKPTVIPEITETLTAEPGETETPADEAAFSASASMAGVRSIPVTRWPAPASRMAK